MVVGSVLLTVSLWKHHHLPASCDWHQLRPWAWKWPQPCSPSCWSRCQPALWSGASPGGREAPGGKAWWGSWRLAFCPRACSAQRRCSPCPRRSHTDLSKEDECQRHCLLFCTIRRWNGTSPVRCIMETPMVCDRVTRKPRLSTICSWNFSSQWAVRKHRELSLTSISSLNQMLSSRILRKSQNLDSRLKNMALTIMAPSGFWTSLVISANLPSVDLEAHSLMEFTALFLSRKLILEWS